MMMMVIKRYLEDKNASKKVYEKNSKKSHVAIDLVPVILLSEL